MYRLTVLEVKKSNTKVGLMSGEALLLFQNEVCTLNSLKGEKDPHMIEGRRDKKVNLLL
jgi:hypothetical protein